MIPMMKREGQDDPSAVLSQIVRNVGGYPAALNAL